MDDKTVEEPKEEKGLKAKTTSLIVKIFVVAFMVTVAILKWTGVLPNASIQEIVIIGGVCAAVFGDVSINTFADKFTGREEK